MDHFLATKLVAPPLPPKMVPRTRLMLPEHAQRLVVVCAPAGYGKSTLLASWGASASVPACWLALDDGDNDPLRFLIHLIKAIQPHYPDFGVSIAGLLGATPLAPVEEMMRSLVNQLCTLPQRICLILDDLHLLDDTAVHKAIAFLVDNQPPQLQMIIASRSEPPFSLARLRGQGQLLEYRASDLRFTPEEAAIFCNDVMHLNLPQPQVETLAARTEGWIVGLQLAAVSMHSAPDKSEFIDSFAGDNRHITDFLLDEVLRSRPEEMQDFLLQTSVLECFNAPLCDAVTGRSDSRAMIDEMERSNIFITGLDQQRCWYRYHHLFTSLLESRLRATRPVLAAQLYRRASRWCSENGLLTKAIDYALKGADHDRAADLLEEHGNQLFSHGQINTILSWTQSLPASLLAQRPALSMMCAWGSFYVDDLSAMDRHIRAAAHIIDGFEQAPPGSAERAMFGQLALARGCRLAYNGDIDGAMMQVREALASLSPERTLHRAAAVYLGVTHLAIGELDKAQPLLEPHSHIGQVKYNVLIPITAVLGLARLHLMRGNLAAARQVYQKAMRDAPMAGLQDFPACGMLHIGMGELSYQMNELDAAQQHLQRGVEMTTGSMQYLNTWGRILLAQTRLAAGADSPLLDSGTEALLAQYAGRFVVDLPPLSATIGRLWLRQNRLDALRQWADTARLPLTAPLAMGREPEYLVLARFFIASRQPDRALEILDQLWPGAERGMRLAVMIEIEIFRALALHAQECTGEALAALRRAISLAEPTGLLRPFIDEGIGLRDLLTRLARGSDYTDHAHRLLSLITAPPDNAPADAAAPLCSLFSKKEKQIVSHIVKGESNQEIAQALFISANTVNSHMKNIYGKLGVKSRLQAISRLRELGMSS